jgi:hypothetical protein
LSLTCIALMFALFIAEFKTYVLTLVSFTLRFYYHPMRD